MKQFLVGQRFGHQQFLGGQGFLIVELLDGRSNQLLIGSLFRIDPKKVLAADQQTATHKQQLQIHRPSHPGQADDILVHGPYLSHALFFQRLGNARHTIPQPGRIFEFFAVGGRFHVLSQPIQQFLIPPLQKTANLFDDAMIVFLRLVAGTGRHTALDFKFQTGPVGRPVDVDLARRQREHLLDDFQGFSKRSRGHVGSKIQRPIVLHATHDRETGKIFLHRQAEIRIVLVIAKHHVEPGAMAFDQVAFE